MDKRYWPSDRKLERLRLEGVLAYSAFAVRAAATVGVLLGVYLSLDVVIDFFR